jgi:hypothetical protein
VEGGSSLCWALKAREEAPLVPFIVEPVKCLTVGPRRNVTVPEWKHQGFMSIPKLVHLFAHGIGVNAERPVFFGVISVGS